MHLQITITNRVSTVNIKLNYKLVNYNDHVHVKWNIFYTLFKVDIQQISIPMIPLLFLCSNLPVD